MNRTIQRRRSARPVFDSGAPLELHRLRSERPGPAADGVQADHHQLVVNADGEPTPEGVDLVAQGRNVGAVVVDEQFVCVGGDSDLAASLNNSLSYGWAEAGRRTEALAAAQEAAALYQELARTDPAGSGGRRSDGLVLSALSSGPRTNVWPRSSASRRSVKEPVELRLELPRAAHR
jgi:hypothetical protein